MTSDHETEAFTVSDHCGGPLVRVRVPRIQRRFRSRLHDAASVAPRLAGWQTELSHFLAGRAPLARLTEESLEPDVAGELRLAVVDALTRGFAGGITVDVVGATTARLAMPDRIADTVDLDALRHDWLWWLNAAGALTEEARASVGWGIDALETRTYASYLWTLPVMSNRDIAEAIQYGIVVGDDPAMTCAAVLRGLTGDRRFWDDSGPA